MIKTLSTIIPFSLLFMASAAYPALYKEIPPNTENFNDGKMRIYLCGTGDPEVTMQEVRKPACLAVAVDNQYLVFDAGEGTVQTLAALGLPYPKIENVFITHWHSDHFGGLGQLINATWNNGRITPINIYGPYGVKSVVRGLQEAYQMDAIYRSTNSIGRLDPIAAFGTPKQISAIQKPQLVYQKSNVKVTAFNVNHAPVYPALGYEINYKSCKIIISGDTNVSDGLKKQSQQADVLISEALSDPLDQEELSAAIKSGNDKEIAFAKETKNYHTDTLSLAKMAQEVSVKNLVLTHTVPAVPTTDEAKTAFTANMNQYYSGPIILSSDKDELILSTKNGTCQISYIPAKQENIKTHKVK